MNSLILAGIAFLAFFSLMLKILFQRKGKSARPGYRKRDFLFSPEERFFHGALKEAVAGDYEIFGRIPALDLLAPRAENDTKAWEAIEDRHFSFVLCNKSDLAVACAIVLQEQDDSGPRAAGGDHLKSACETAGLPLVRLRAGPLHEAGEIREAIARAVRKEPLYLTESDGRKEPRISGLENFEP